MRFRVTRTRRGWTVYAPDGADHGTYPTRAIARGFARIWTVELRDLVEYRRAS